MIIRTITFDSVRVMKSYMTLCYAIKNGVIGLLKYALREIAIIFQARAAKKPKYAKALLRQVHIIDTKAADPVLQEVYLAKLWLIPKNSRKRFMRWISS